MGPMILCCSTFWWGMPKASSDCCSLAWPRTDFECDVGYVLADATAPGVSKKEIATKLLVPAEIIPLESADFPGINHLML